MLNISKGNMYEFVTHTWNTVKGACMHDCSYCYMKRWGKLNPARFDVKELKTDLGSDNFIFVGSSNDLFAENISYEWIEKTLNHCANFKSNNYLLQTKNPGRISNDENIKKLLYKLGEPIITTTIESNIFYPKIMHDAPEPEKRAEAIHFLSQYFQVFVTIEPILDFELKEFVSMIDYCNPLQVNIGADSGKNDLPEPNKYKINQLINELQKFTVIHNKKNLKRLIK